MRVRPDERVTCRICGTTYTVRYTYNGRYIFGGEKAPPGPQKCPACQAPYKRALNRETELGRARSLLFTLTSSRYFRRAYQTAADYLVDRSRDESDVEHLVSLAERMDYDAWEQQNKECVEPDRKLTLHERESLKWIPLLGAEMRSGALLPKLRAAQSAACDVLRAERARHLAIYEARRSK